MRARANSCFLPEVFSEYWSGFTFTFSELLVSEEDDLIFTIGNAEELSLDGYSYSVNVTNEGICIRGESKTELIRGFMTMIDRIYAKDAEDGDKRAKRVIYILDHFDKALTTLLIGTNVTHAGIATLSTVFTYNLFAKGMNALRHFGWAHGFIPEVYLEDEKLDIETLDTSVIFDK